MSHSKLDKQAKLRALRGIVAHHQHGQVAGCTVDLTSAHAILTLYDALKPENQDRLLSLHPYKMAEIAFKLLK